MIRVYFDWNVITELKKENGKYRLLNGKIKKYRSALLIPFSNYHVEDLIKNNLTPDKVEKFITPDLEFLGQLSEEQFLGVDKDGKTLVQVGSPLDFLDTIEDNNLEELLDFNTLFGSDLTLHIEDTNMNYGNLIKSTFEIQSVPEAMTNGVGNPLTSRMFPSLKKAESMWDIIKDFYQFNKNMFLDKQFLKDFRADVQETTVKPDPNHGNWSPKEVIHRIDKGLQEKGIGLSFAELLDKTMKEQKNITRATYFTTAYLMLDFYGYKPDKLNKPSNSFLNIINDANHSYIGAYCDFVVSNDENFLAKTKVLYYLFNIQTTVLKPEEFTNLIDTIVHHPIGTPQEVLDLAVSFIDEKYLLDVASNEEINKQCYIYKLPVFFFNYFNYLIEDIVEENLTVLTFRRVFKNYSDFVYYKDTKQLLSDLFSCFGESNYGRSYPDIEKDFVYCEEKTSANVFWSFGQVHFVLEKEVEERRECLKIIVDNRPAE